MLNIGVDISPLTSSARTGVGEYTFELLNALFHIDTQNQYFLFYNAFKDVSGVIPKWDQDNVHFVHTRWPNKIFHLCVQFLQWPKVDQIIQKKTGVKLDYFFSPNIGFQSISKSCKHILTLHDLSFEIFPECLSLRRRLWHAVLLPKKQCRMANIIFTPSNNTKRDSIDMYGISEEKVKVLSPGLSNAFVGQEIKISQEVKQKYSLPEKYVLFLGTIEPRKNIEGVIHAFKMCPDLISQGYELIIAGAKGWKYKSILKSIEQTKGVRYIGYIDPAEKPSLYAGASLFVYPSLYEGFGFPLLEAMASGTPVITSNRSSLPEIAEGSAYYINPYNMSEIAEGMKKILQSSELSNFFVQKGFVQIKKFNWQKTAEQFLASLSSYE